MTTMTGLLAVAMMGAAPVAEPCDEAISVQIRVLDMDGLGWRSDAYAKLRPVATRGTSTVWTADRSLLDDLVAKAQGVASTSRVEAVGEAALSQKKTVHYVAKVDRIADGPINGATSVAYRPEVGTVETGIEARVSGRKLDQGMLAQVALADSRVLAMHTVRVREMVSKEEGRVGRAESGANPVLDDAWRVAYEMAFGTMADRLTRSIGLCAATFQVPEIAKAEVEGEWLIPNNGILVVSLGIDTVSNHLGRAIPRERLAVVEVLADVPPTPIAVSQLNQTPSDAPKAVASVEPSLPSNNQNDVGPDRNEPFPGRTYRDIVTNVDEPPTGRLKFGIGAASFEGTAAKDDAVVAAGFEAIPPLPVLPSPKAPARMLPLPIDANGHAVELPPLPIAESTLDEMARPASVRPSPQTTVRLSMADPALAQASFVAPAPGVTTSIVSTSGPSLGLGLQMKDGRGTPVQEVEKDLTSALKAPGRTETIRVPLGGNLSLEIKATVVPSKAAEPAVAGKPDDSADRR